MRSKSRTSLIRPIVRSSISDGPAMNEPPGTSTFWRCTASRTASTVSPYALRRSALSRSWISRRRSPMKLTSPTSLTVSSTCLIFLSEISVISFGERSPETTIVRMGAASGSVFWMTGGKVSRGNFATMVATLSRTSWTAISMSRSRMKVTKTIEKPWLE